MLYSRVWRAAEKLRGMTYHLMCSKYGVRVQGQAVSEDEAYAIKLFIIGATKNFAIYCVFRPTHKFLKKHLPIVG